MKETVICLFVNSGYERHSASLYLSLRLLSIAEERKKKQGLSFMEFFAFLLQSEKVSPYRYGEAEPAGSKTDLRNRTPQSNRII